MQTNQAAAATKELTDFFESEECLRFVSSMAKLNAHYYLELVKAGVPSEAAATIAANYKAGPGQ